MVTILCIVGFQAFLTMLLIYLNQNFKGADRYLILMCFAIFLHASYKYLLFTIFGGGYYFENIHGSFSLLYGPLAYFFLLSTQNIKVGKRVLFLHSTPFLLMLLFNLFVIGAILLEKEPAILINFYHYFMLACVTFSFGGYSIFFFRYLKRKKNSSIVEKEQNKIFLLFSYCFGVIVILVFAGLIFQAFSFPLPFNLRFPFYALLLILFSGIIHFKMRISYLENEKLFKLDKIENKEPQSTKYKTSKILDKEMEAIARQLESFFQKEKPYLDPDLNLDDLSFKMKIPKNYLTQTLNTYLGQSFYQYINNARVEESISHLKKTKGENITQIGFECGFKSKSTFYKYFKERTGYSPLEFRETRFA